MSLPTCQYLKKYFLSCYFMFFHSKSSLQITAGDRDSLVASFAICCAGCAPPRTLDPLHIDGVHIGQEPQLAATRRSGCLELETDQQPMGLTTTATNKTSWFVQENKSGPWIHQNKLGTNILWSSNKYLQYHNLTDHILRQQSRASGSVFKAS